MNIGNGNNVPTVLSTAPTQSAMHVAVSEAERADGNGDVTVLAQNLSILTGQDNLLGEQQDLLLADDKRNPRSVAAIAGMESAVNLLGASSDPQETRAALRQLSLSQSNVNDALNAQTNQLVIKATNSAVETSARGPAHITELSNTIGLIKTNFLDVYRDITKQTTEYFSAFMDAVGGMSKYIHPGNDKDNPNKILFYGTDFSRDLLTPLINQYTGKVLYTLPSPIAPEALDFWTTKLAPDLLVSKNGEIKANLDTLIKINNAVQPRFGEILTASFQALQSEVDSLKSRQQSAITRIMDSYRQDLSTFDNLINLLMGMYATETKINEGFLRY